MRDAWTTYSETVKLVAMLAVVSKVHGCALGGLVSAGRKCEQCYVFVEVAGDELVVVKLRVHRKGKVQE